MPRIKLFARLSSHLAWLFVAATLATGTVALAEPLPPQIGAEEALALSRDGKLTIVDVRAPAEWRETGIAPGARTVTIHDPRGVDGFVAEVLKAVDGDKARPVALICHSGTRSVHGQKILAAAGFTQVTDIGAGMVGKRDQPGWIAQGLPAVPCNC